MHPATTQGVASTLPQHNPFRSALSFNTSQQSPLMWSGTGTTSSGPNGLRTFPEFQQIPYNCGPHGLRQGGDLAEDYVAPLALDGQDVPRFGPGPGGSLTSHTSVQHTVATPTTLATPCSNSDSNF